MACRNARCGDRAIWNGHEVCDDGVNDGTEGHCSADCAVGPEGCVDPLNAQSIAGDIMGCGGSVGFWQRGDLCGRNWHVCSAAEWVERHGDVVPENHYWTDDADLGYGFTGGEGGIAFTCWVDHAGIDGGVSSCDPDEPMRVCAPGENGNAPLDSEGSPIGDSFFNYCNWINCGFGAYPPTEFFGGCNGNGSAGTLCCR